MLKGIEVLIHSSIKINKNNIILYIDPFKIESNYNDADIIFITHEHYDHYSEDDIIKVKNKNTIIVVPEGLFKKSIKMGFSKENIITVVPNKNYKIKDIKFSTTPAYNILKPFHPKSNNWVGYIIELNNIKYYIAGDTDLIKEIKEVDCDVAFIPVRRHLYNES